MNRPAGAGSANENIRKKIQMQRNDEIVLTAQQHSKLSTQLQEQSRRSSLS